MGHCAVIFSADLHPPQLPCRANALEVPPEVAQAPGSWNTSAGLPSLPPDPDEHGGAPLGAGRRLPVGLVILSN